MLWRGAGHVERVRAPRSPVPLARSALGQPQESHHLGQQLVILAQGMVPTRDDTQGAGRIALPHILEGQQFVVGTQHGQQLLGMARRAGRLISRQVCLQCAQLVHEFGGKVEMLARVMPQGVGADIPSQAVRRLDRRIDDYRPAASTPRQPAGVKPAQGRADHGHGVGGPGGRVAEDELAGGPRRGRQDRAPPGHTRRMLRHPVLGELRLGRLG